VALHADRKSPAYWPYQSNGWCHDHCVANYSFAIVQGFNCWCSDYAPASTTSLSNCNTKCPGFTEYCGGNGLFGYIALSLAPAGTIDASASSSSVVSGPVLNGLAHASAPPDPRLQLSLVRSEILTLSSAAGIGDYGWLQGNCSHG
jgi:hypothetical protein